MAIKINGKHGGIALKAGGIGAVTDFILSIQGLPASVTIKPMKSTLTTAEWDAVEKSRSPHGGRHLLVVTATQTKTRLHIKEAIGDTDEISVTVTNAALGTDTDAAPLDVVFI